MNAIFGILSVIMTVAFAVFAIVAFSVACFLMFILAYDTYLQLKGHK